MKNNLIKTEMDVKSSKIGIMRVGNIDYISLILILYLNLLVSYHQFKL